MGRSKVGAEIGWVRARNGCGSACVCVSVEIYVYMIPLSNSTGRCSYAEVDLIISSRCCCVSV